MHMTDLTEEKRKKRKSVIKNNKKSNEIICEDNSMLLCDDKSYECPYEMIENDSNTNDITNIITNNSCSIDSDVISKLSINNSYICQQSLTLSNTISATSNVSFAVSEEDGLSEGRISPHNIDENEYFIKELIIQTDEIESTNNECDSEYNNNNNNNNIVIAYNECIIMKKNVVI